MRGEARVEAVGGRRREKGEVEGQEGTVRDPSSSLHPWSNNYHFTAENLGPGYKSPYAHRLWKCDVAKKRKENGSKGLGLDGRLFGFVSHLGGL